MISAAKRVSIMAVTAALYTVFFASILFNYSAKLHSSIPPNNPSRSLSNLVWMERTGRKHGWRFHCWRLRRKPRILRLGRSINSSYHIRLELAPNHKKCSGSKNKEEPRHADRDICCYPFHRFRLHPLARNFLPPNIYPRNRTRHLHSNLRTEPPHRGSDLPCAHTDAFAQTESMGHLLWHA